MTNEELDALDKYLAEGPMGWIERGLYWCMESPLQELPQIVISKKEWKPSRLIQQAEMVLDVMLTSPYSYECYLAYQTSGWGCYLTKPDGPEAYCVGDRMAEAICLAVKQAWGGGG